MKRYAISLCCMTVQAGLAAAAQSDAVHKGLTPVLGTMPMRVDREIIASSLGVVAHVGDGPRDRHTGGCDAESGERAFVDERPE